MVILAPLRYASVTLRDAERMNIHVKYILQTTIPGYFFTVTMFVIVSGCKSTNKNRERRKIEEKILKLPDETVCVGASPVPARTPERRMETQKHTLTHTGLRVLAPILYASVPSGRARAGTGPAPTHRMEVGRGERNG